MHVRRHWTKLATLIAVTMAFLGLALWTAVPAATQAAQTTPSTNERPSWVKPNGSIDRSKLPECFNIAGPDGKVVLGTDGKPLCGKPFDLPTTEPDEEVAKRTVPSGAQVPSKRPPGAPSGPNDRPSPTASTQP